MMDVAGNFGYRPTYSHDSEALENNGSAGEI